MVWCNLTYQIERLLHAPPSDSRQLPFLHFIFSLDFRLLMSLFVVKRTDQLDFTLRIILSEIENVEVYRAHFDSRVSEAVVVWSCIPTLQSTTFHLVIQVRSSSRE